jgi:hypothetical protein
MLEPAQHPTASVFKVPTMTKKLVLVELGHRAGWMISRVFTDRISWFTRAADLPAAELQRRGRPRAKDYSYHPDS